MAEKSRGSLPRSVHQEPAFVRWTWIASAVVVMTVLVVLPVVKVFYEALGQGLRAYWDHVIHDPDTRAAILLTLRVTFAAVLANSIFGLAAAWAIARFKFSGRALLISLIDLPFAVSPVVAGMSFVFLFGLQGYLGPWLREHGINIVFNTPGLILATAFVTLPFVARELVPLMEAIGAEDEVAAVSLGARPWQLFWRITLPNIRWGLLYGLILCNARAVGEFGAVSVVSGRITGETDTMALRVEKLFQEYNMPGAFALASLLSLLAVVTLVLKRTLEWKTRRDLRSRLSEPTEGPVATVQASSFDREGHKSEPNTVGGVGCSGLAGISVRDVTKRFGAFTAVNRVTLEVPDGAFVALLGPSGSGKTTLLRIIAGLEVPDEGAVFYHGEDVTNRAARERNVGFVFQHYALFRHMTVFDNVAFGLRVRRWKKADIERRVRELLSLVKLEGMSHLLPSQLSGGQRQRVALARALAPAPKVMLLDEPFGALDARVRKELRQWLRKLHDELRVTTLLVTHDQEEAFEVADRIVVMNQGCIEQEGTPEEVFERPANAFVMDFLGNVNVFHCRLGGGRALLGDLELAYAHEAHEEAKAVTAYVRPHEFEVDRIPRGTSSLKAEVMRIVALGAAARLELFAIDFGLPIRVELARDRLNELRIKKGDRVFVSPKQVRVFVHNYQI